MFALVVFLAAFMGGMKAGAIGALIGLAVGAGAGLVFYFSVSVLFVWLPRRLGLSETTSKPRLSMFFGWVLAVVGFIWLILCAESASWLTKLLLSLVPRHYAGYVVDDDVWGQGQDEERRKQTTVKLDELAACIRVFYKLRGGLPAEGDSLITSLKKMNVAMIVPRHYPACYGESMCDAWGQEIDYSLTNSMAVLTSSGADRIRGTMDDIALRIMLHDGTNAIWGFNERMILKRAEKGN